jgi:hypothetical protein
MSNIKWVMVPGIAALAAILTLGLAGTSTAFHDGGVAHCDGCHTMHNSVDNAEVTANPNSQLLMGSDASSTCLNCHNGASRYHVNSDNGSNYTPGGDFFWLTKDYTYNNHGDVNHNGQATGHNVVASDYGLVADTVNTSAPGGGFPSTFLGCESCHDPHGSVDGGTAAGTFPISVSGSYGDIPPAGTIAGNYRLLRDFGAADAPIAVVDGWVETDTDHVAYGQGMSEWCASCHGAFINTNLKHPSGNGQGLNGGSSSTAANYNAYVKTGLFTGSQTTSYTALVPFERQETDTATLLAGVTSTEGPAGGENVMCLTCHRAHASAFNNSTRWNMETEFLAHGYPTLVELAPEVTDITTLYYGRDIVGEFGEYQRSLCNKCHVKD